MTQKKKHQIFNKSKRKHILLITNHGCHSPIIEVTTDTGGQNFYVNDLAKALLELGYKTSILNRGGFGHPKTGTLHEGIKYYDDIWGEQGQFCRIIYLEDNQKQFIPKEQLVESNLEEEKEFFFEISEEIELSMQKILFINSHYWDAGILGLLIQNEAKERYNLQIPHIWTPHSLGILKQKNYLESPKEVIEPFNFPSRIKYEEQVIRNVDGVVSTSKEIKDTFSEYQAQNEKYFWFPPGIDIKKYKRRSYEECPNGLSVLEKEMGKNREEIISFLQQNIFFIESSRTAETKRKDLVIKAFSKIKNQDKAILLVNVDKKSCLYSEIKKIYEKYRNERMILIEYFLKDDELAELFSLANVYITCSVMEGWGMAVQEAVGAYSAVISSKYVPFVTEVLKENAIIISKNDATLYAEAMDRLIDNKEEREKFIKFGSKIVSKEYSWVGLTEKLILDLTEQGIIDE